MNSDFIARIIVLGQAMRNDIRPADDQEELAARWDALMRELGTETEKALVVIRAFLDGDRDAREKGQDWIAENTP
jgi:hypothetical protein